jgi:HlyD family secretion protein
VDSLDADFNSRVRKNQVIARLETSTFDARLSQAQANLVAARANVEKARATVSDTKQKYDRAQELSKEGLVPASDLDTARANYEGAVAGLRGAQAAVSQAAASVQQAQVDRTHTIIRAPIDGVVVARNVDVGQTVAASLQAPTLFVIANDLSRMQVNASIDEADIGRVRQGQDVTFHVDAYPNETFTGRVEQVRLQPITVSNVVTYNTLIAVDNPGGRLMPGMTATVSLIVQKRDDVLRLPAAALRFRPEGWQAGAGGRRGGAGGNAPSGASGAPPAAAGAGGGVQAATAPGGQGPEGGARARRGGGRSAGRADGAGGRGASGPGTPGGQEGGQRAIVFVPGPDGKPQPQPIRTGITDGQYVEVLSGLEDGAQIVTGIAGEGGARAAGGRPGASPAANPFAPQQPQRRTR